MLDQAEARDETGPLWFNDHVLQGARDQSIIARIHPCDKSGQVPALSDVLSQADIVTEDLSGGLCLDHDVRMDYGAI